LKEIHWEGGGVAGTIGVGPMQIEGSISAEGRAAIAAEIAALFE